MSNTIKTPEECAKLIVNELIICSVSVAISLPDTWMGALLAEVDQEMGLEHVRVTSEIEGVGICCGLYYGGVSSCLIIANAGFLHCAYELPTLAMMHRIPLFMLVSSRGKLGDTAFYQEYQGLLTEPLMDLMDIQYAHVDSVDDIPRIADVYRHSRAYRRPAAALLTKPVLA